MDDFLLLVIIDSSPFGVEVMSEKELRVPAECSSVEHPQAPPVNNMLEEYHRLISEKSTQVFDQGILKGYGDDRHLISYLSGDGREQLSVLLRSNPDTGKEVPWSIQSLERGDLFNLRTGAREEALWRVPGKDGDTHVAATIDPASEAVLGETGTIWTHDWRAISSFKYGFNEDGDATKCLKVDGGLSYTDGLDDANWQMVWSAKQD
jgi:hypothetical protein